MSKLEINLEKKPIPDIAISRNNVLSYLSDLQFAVAPMEGKESIDAYTALEWAITSITGMSEYTGTWLYNPNGMDWNLPAWVCSECGARNDNIPATMVIKGEKQKINPYAWAGSKYCPNCGRLMMPREKEE